MIAEMSKKLGPERLAKITLETETGKELTSYVLLDKTEEPVTETRQCSPTEKSILGCLADGKWRKGSEIAKMIGMSKSSYFSAILTNMAEAEILEVSRRLGYRLSSRLTDTQNVSN